MNWWKSLQSKVRLARQLSPGEWLTLAEAWWLLIVFSLALRWQSFEHLKESFRLSGRKKVDPPGVLGFAQRLENLIYLAARLHLFPMPCLTRACTLHWMLGRNGIPSRLCIGANKSLGRFSAHAWVVVAGQAIGEPEDISDTFKTLSSSAEKEPPELQYS